RWNYPFLVYSLSLIILVLTYFYLKEPTPKKEQVLNGNSKMIRKKRTVAGIYFLVFLGMLLFYFIPVQSPFLINQLGVSSSFLISVALVASTLFAAISSFAYGRIRHKLNFKSIFLLTFSGVAIGYLVLFIARDYLVVLVGLTISGAGLGLLMPNANTWLIQISPPAIRGKLIGGLTSIVFLGQFLSPIAAKPLIENFQLSGLFLNGALISAVLFFLLLVWKILKKKLATA
ncbi:MAG: MFS transporter, partial [Cyclobacteriaceae bacterium]